MKLFQFITNQLNYDIHLSFDVWRTPNTINNYISIFQIPWKIRTNIITIIIITNNNGDSPASSQAHFQVPSSLTVATFNNNKIIQILESNQEVEKKKFNFIAWN